MTIPFDFSLTLNSLIAISDVLALTSYKPKTDITKRISINNKNINYLLNVLKNNKFRKKLVNSID